MSNSKLPEVAQLYVSNVMHRRLTPMQYKFTYRIFGILCDIDNLERLGTLSKLVSYNRFNLFSFYDTDHGRMDGSALKPWIKTHLAKHDIENSNIKVYLHSMPRVLGYTFNPISYWFCYDSEDRLLAILVEVHNTFGDQHSYLLPAPAASNDKFLRAHKKKNLHVSPLIDMDAEYQFKINQPGDTFSAVIRETQNKELMLVAAQHGKRRKITSISLIKLFLGLPFMTLKVISMIHWQALKIYLKGGKFYRRPEPPREEVS